jgi:hypothetical protein
LTRPTPVRARSHETQGRRGKSSPLFKCQGSWRAKSTKESLATRPSGAPPSGQPPKSTGPEVPGQVEPRQVRRRAAASGSEGPVHPRRGRDSSGLSPPAAAASQPAGSLARIGL